MSNYDTWKTRSPDDELYSAFDGIRDYPCNWEKMSGVCMVCGAGPDEECEIEREERRASKGLSQSRSRVATAHQ